MRYISPYLIVLLFSFFSLHSFIQTKFDKKYSLELWLKSNDTDQFTSSKSSSYIDISLQDIDLIAQAVQKINTNNTFNIFSHGKSGELLINGQWLNAKQIVHWLKTKQLLSQPTRQLNIYGCEFAKGEKGLKAIAYIEKELAVKVNASTNITGKDGDWLLEVGNFKSTIELKNYTYNLQCANQGTAPNEDYDCDGVINKDDLDDDNDGILDIDEQEACTAVNLDNSNINNSTVSGTTTTTLSNGNSLTSTMATSHPNLVASSAFDGFSDGIVTTRFTGPNEGNTTDYFEVDYTFSEPVKLELSYPGVGGNTQGTHGSSDVFELLVSSGGFEVNNPNDNSISITQNTETIISFFPDSGGDTTELQASKQGYTVTTSEALTNVKLRFRNLTTSIGNNMSIKVRVLCSGNLDTDNDGVSNHLDLDSDGDGCPDAIEGDASYTATNLVTDTNIDGGNTGASYIGTANGVQQNLGTTIDIISTSPTYGVPIVDPATTASPQGNGDSQIYGLNTECCTDASNYPAITDSDNDNIGDNCDLDDDNDGVLDTNEGLVYSGHLTNTTTYCSTNQSVPSSITQNFTDVHRNNDTQNVGATQTYHFDLPISRASFGVVSLQELNAYYGNFTITYEDNTVVSNVDFTIKNSSQYTTEENAWIQSFSFGNRSANISKLTLGTGEVVIEGLGSPGNQGAGIITFNSAAPTRLIKSISLQNLSNGAGTGGPYTNFEIFGSPKPCDIDNDGVPDYLDLDSDGDGCPDVIESAVPTVLESVGVNANDGIADNTSDAVIDITKDAVGDNGYANSLENVDTDAATTIDAYTSTNYTSYALDNTKNGCGQAMITQVYWKGSEKIIEVTNNDASKIIVPNAANLNFFNDGVITSRTATWANATEITGGNSILFTVGSISAQTNSGVSTITDAGVTGFDSSTDIITISRSGKASTTLAYESRVDAVQSLTDNTSFVRIDELLNPNATFTSSEWIAFVDDNLDPYRVIGSGGPERHPHDPLLSEVTSGVNTEANALLGLHRFGLTNRTGAAWDNGFPDRSRHVQVSEDYNHNSSALNARKLSVANNSKLAITDNLLAVTDDITLTGTNDEIRLIGTSQLVTTHTNGTQVTGNGKLYVDQNSEVPSTYRYNYFGSPVNSIGANTYTVADVFKDGSTPTSTTSTAVDINFVGGYNGSTTTPISIAEYWIYTYGAEANWTQKLSGGTIPQTDGVIFKGPGQPQNYTFVGTPKDGRLQTTVVADTDYLLGNPYASAISVQRFIEDNLSSTTGALYFWEHKESIHGDTNQNSHNYNGYVGGYAIRNIAMGLAANNPSNTVNDNLGIAGLGSGPYREPGRYVPVGQGFFIEGSATGGTVEFNNSQREYILEGTNSVFFRNGSDDSTIFTENDTSAHSASTSNLPIIKLGMDYVGTNNVDLHQQIGISFLQGNTFTFDTGYDAPIIEDLATGFFWDFELDDTNYAIAGVQEITDDLQVPLTITMGYSGNIKIRIDEWANINRNVYLIDTIENINYLISDTPADIFLNAGLYTDRYVLAFRAEETLSVAETALSSQFYVYVEDTTEDIMIVNTNRIDLEDVELYDVLGKQIQSWDITSQYKEGNSFRLKTNKISSGIYYLRLKSAQGLAEKKVYLGF